MGWLSGLLRVGGMIGAPFTGGWSAIGGNLAAEALDSRGNPRGKALGAGDLLTKEGQAYGGMAKGLIGDATKGFNTVGGYLNPLVSGDPKALAEWTATSAADEARRTQNIARQAGAGARSGGTAAATLGALQGQRSAALSNRINARMTATQALTDLSSRQGQLGTATGGLGISALGGAANTYGDAFRADIYKAQGEQGLWKDIGGGLMDVLIGRKNKNKGQRPMGVGGGDYGGETNPPIVGGDYGGETNSFIDPRTYGGTKLPYGNY